MAFLAWCSPLSHYLSSHHPLKTLQLTCLRLSNKHLQPHRLPSKNSKNHRNPRKQAVTRHAHVVAKKSTKNAAALSNETQPII